MKALVFVRPGEDVTLPEEIMEAAGIEPGDAVAFSITGVGSVEIRVLPLPPIEDVFGGDATISRTPAGDADAPVDFDALPILTVEELVKRYRIEGPIDFHADREAWYDEAAKDVFGERPDRFSH